MQPLEQHIHDHLGPEGSCAACFVWAKSALAYSIAHPEINVIVPRTFDKVARVWVQPKKKEDLL